MRRSQFVIERAAEQSSDSSIMRRRLARLCLANQFVHNLSLLVRADGIQLYFGATGVSAPALTHNFSQTATNFSSSDNADPHTILFRHWSYCAKIDFGRFFASSQYFF